MTETQSSTPKTTASAGTAPKADDTDKTLATDAESGASDLAVALHGDQAAEEKYAQPTPVAQTVGGTLIGDPTDHPERDERR